LKSAAFDPGCRRCPRLSAFLDEVRAEHPSYYCRPVAPFGDDCPGLLIVGLAPGRHGANATGRPFTGDHAGVLLYRTLHRFGFADRAESRAVDDGLVLIRCRITNAVKCLPPANKPVAAEVWNCNAYLAEEIRDLRDGAVVLALGSVAHEAVLRATGHRRASYRFGHGAEHDLGNLRLLDSYHCSRYNTQTGRLTDAMFEAVFERARSLLRD